MYFSILIYDNPEDYKQGIKPYKKEGHNLKDMEEMLVYIVTKYWSKYTAQLMVMGMHV